MRINKYISSSGFCSRRRADQLIQEGKVKINGKVASLGSEIGEKDEVKVDNEIINLINNKVYYMLNKPKGYITANSDKEHRVVLELMNIDERVFPIGRLDFDTEGLLLLTNDGDLVNKLIHPKAEITKKYYVILNGFVGRETIQNIREGVMLDNRLTHPCKVEDIVYKTDRTFLKITITEGRNRQIRRMFDLFKFKVTYLQRLAIGSINLGSLVLGHYRKLREKELNYLKNL